MAKHMDQRDPWSGRESVVRESHGQIVIVLSRSIDWAFEAQPDTGHLIPGAEAFWSLGACHSQADGFEHHCRSNTGIN